MKEPQSKKRVDSKSDHLNQVQKKSFWTRYALWLLVPIILALYFSHDKTVLAEIKHERVVLPILVKPIHYQLELTPDLNTFIYNGTVKVDLQVLEKTSVIVLNSNEIVIETASVVAESASYTATDIQYDTKTDQTSLTFNQVLPKGASVLLEIKFQGTLNDRMSGFYRSSYKDSKGDIKFLATTQFEATDARRAFPCWDEPSLKATFDVTLNVPSDLTALSNMDVISETPSTTSADLKTVKYATTPRMSTYLLAIVIGPFEYIEANTTGKYNGRPIRTRVYTLPGLTHQGQHALSVATQTLEYYAQVFGVPYPLPKLDMVAIPDFDAGAMENWGLVTYRTTALLYDEKQSAFIYKKQTAYTVAHELAHQWFGNLVTMEWWDHLWLNEGFATWVGWFAVDHIFPEWRVWTMFATQNMQRALDLDGLRSSHPVEVAVNNPSEIHQIFDSISYQKGASVIRMVVSWLTSPVFLSGIHNYLEKHRLANAATNDLWDALSEESGKDVSEFMSAWVEKIGCPVLNVSINGKGQIQVTQSRYLLTGDLQEDEDSTTWWVPLQLKTNGKVEQYVLTNKSQVFTIPENAPFKLNQGQASLYRVNYSKELIQQFIDELKSPKSGVLDEPIDRAGIISDLGVLCHSGEQTSVNFLALVDALKGEKDYFVLTELSHQLNNIISLYEGFDYIEPHLQKIRRDIFSPLAQTLGWEGTSNEPDLNRLLRVLAISEAGLAGDVDVIAEAKRRYSSFIEKGTQSAILPDLRSSVFTIILANAVNEQEENQRWEEIYGIYNDETYPMDQRVTALTTLGSGIKSEGVIERTLALILDEKSVRTQDAWMTFRSLGENYISRDKLFQFYKSNYDAIYSRFSKSMGALGNTVSYMISGVNNFEKIEEIENFFSTKDTSEYSRGLNGAIEKAKVNAAQIQREHIQIKKWAAAIAAMNKEYGISWNLVYDTLKHYYYSFDQSAQHSFNKFYDPIHFFAPTSLTVGIPLSLGRSTSNSKYEVIMAMHIYEQLLDFIHQEIPSVPPPLANITPKEYMIIETFEADQSNDLSKYQQKAKKKNKQQERLRAAKKEFELAKRLINDSKYVFVSIDIEAYELDHSILLEIGWSMFDAKTKLYKDQHYIMDNYRHLKNSKFVDDQKEKFMFGISVWCSLKQALIELRKDLDWAVERDGGFVLVGHGIDSDIKYLQKQKFLWPTVHGQNSPTVEGSAIIAILNTDTIYAASIGDLHNPPSLGKTLGLLDIETWSLHNAGNDAHYTLLLLLKLVSEKKYAF